MVRYVYISLNCLINCLAIMLLLLKIAKECILLCFQWLSIGIACFTGSYDQVYICILQHC